MMSSTFAARGERIRIIDMHGTLSHISEVDAMALLRTSVAWFALGVGIGRFQPRTHGNSCIRDLSHNEARSSASSGLEHAPVNPNFDLVNETDFAEEPYFHRIFQFAYDLVHPNNTATATIAPKRKDFDARSWDHESNGGLEWSDREYLGEVYRQATSVFEYGLGESTMIADHVGVPRYSGIDSDPVWVREASRKVASHFRFYLGDIGKTAEWGFPLKKLDKAYLNYQLAPLAAEPEPFDVYFVDGRFRFACMMASFLHASARKGSKDDQQTLVILHDCQRKVYHKADHLLNLTFASRKLCAYTRLPSTTDKQLFKFWKKHYKEQA